MSGGTLIQDLDNSIRNLVSYELGADITASINLGFDSPNPAVAGMPVAAFFLYDLRRDEELSVPTAAFPIKCTYLVTCVAGEALQEQQILSYVLAALSKHPYIPATLPNKEAPDGPAVPILTESMSMLAETPPRALTARPGHIDDVGAFWKALQLEPRTAFNYEVSFAMLPPTSIR